jgi:hypothetical protein
MREETTRLLFDEARYQREEFYGKVMEWHTRWTDEVRSMYHITHYRWPALKSLHTLVKNLKGGRAPAQSGAQPAAQPVPARHTEPSTE